MFHLKGFRPRKASPTPSRHGKRQAQPAAAVRRPDLTGLYAAEFPYQPSSIEFLRARAAWCRATADDLDTHARDDIAWAARYRGESADLDRMADLAEQERAMPTEQQAPTSPETAQTAPVPGQVVHYQDHVGFWPPCGARESATFATDDTERVTCQGCLAEMVKSPWWTPTSEADAAGWNEPLTAPPVADTAVLEAVDGSAR